MAGRRVREGSLAGGLPYLRLGQGPPLVVLSGLTAEHANPTGLSRAIGLLNLRPLARSATVWYVNRPPGASLGTTMADLAAAYAAALREAFAGPVDVAGLSTGGSVALQLAVDHPDLVKRLIVVASAYRLGEPARRSQRHMAAMAKAGHRRQVDWHLGWTMGRSMVSSVVAGVLYWLAGPVLFGTAADPSDMIATIEAEERFDVGARLDAIKVPTLVIGGTDDQFYQADGQRLITETAAGIPGARLILYEGRGHAGTLMDRRLARDVLAFLAEDGHA